MLDHLILWNIKSFESFKWPRGGTVRQWSRIPGLVCLFNGISTFVGYLMLKPFA